MGNKCCSREQKKERADCSVTSLQLIKEAQRKYFNSHIESDVDESDEGDDKDDSTDGGLYGSDNSLINGDENTSDNDIMNASVISDSKSALQSIDNTADKSASVLENVVLINKDSTDQEVVSLRTTDTVVKVEGKSKAVGSKSKPVKMREKAKYIRLNKRGNFYSIFNTEDKKARTVDPKMYEYPFENIVFEGGGNKGLAYCGAVRLLEELNIWPQIKRIAGTSAGAMTAALLAVGYDSHDLEAFFSLNLNNIFLDHKFGYLSLLPNLLTSYGWNPGKRIYKWFGQKIFEKTGDMDTTFKQIYERYNRELCLVVTNLNQMTTLYCHPKTTPDMPVRLAVRMSMSIPGMFEAVRHTLHGHTDIFVDGGVLCNYPIHCFDGWWLSMKPEDNFLEKLQPLEDIPRLLERSERFGTYNEKTLGMQLYSDNEQDLLKYQLENLRHGVQLQELPNTKLAREKIRKKKLQLKTDREHRRLVKAMNAFLRALNKHNVDRNDTIDREELEAALNDETSFPISRKRILFGDVGSATILDYLDKDHNGQISYTELLSFMEETGLSMQNRFLGYQRRVIVGFSSFLDTLQATLLTNVKRVYVEERDLKRTVGINTGHVGTSDFVLEPADIEFVLERGRRSLEAFLKYYVANNHLKKKAEYRRYSNDIRKDSKCSLASSSSNQSLESGNNSTALTVPNVVVSAYTLSPLAEGLTMATYHNSSTTQDEPLGRGRVHFEHHCRCQPDKIPKYVSISDTVEVIGNSPRVRLRDCQKQEGDEKGEEENSDENSECIFLLGDKKYEDKINHRQQSSASMSKIEDTLPASPRLPDRAVSTEFNEMNSTLDNCMSLPDNSSVITKDNVKLSGLQSSITGNVQVHKSKGKYESSTTPLLQPTESQDSIELHALSKGH